jgi:hypothetical protein
LGGPATFFSFLIILGTITRVASNPIGLSVGPVRTLAVKPYAKKTAIGNQSVRLVISVRIRTHAATVLAAYSLTGFGNEKRLPNTAVDPHIS